LSPTALDHVVKDLSDLLEKMPHHSGAEFSKLDVAFHRRIAQEANKASDELESTFAFNYRIGGWAARADENREAIISEHQRIVDALRQKNFGEAQKASTHHLQQVFQRWLPGYDAKAETRNVRFFAPLGRGGALLWTGTVAALEWRGWSMLGK